MKIISLNIWDANREVELREFIDYHLRDTDIFCFQEVFGPEAKSLLDRVFLGKDFSEVETHKHINENDNFDLVTLVSNKHKVLATKELFANDDLETGQALAVKIASSDRELWVINVHGTARPGDKLDTEVRLRQSQQIIDFTQSQELPSDILGDFNLDMSTESVAKFTKSGFNNLIASYQIPTTRNKLAWEKHPDNPQMYADYTFSSGDLKVDDFQVIDNEASDHLPMILKLGL